MYWRLNMAIQQNSGDADAAPNDLALGHQCARIRNCSERLWGMLRTYPIVLVFSALIFTALVWMSWKREKTHV